MTGYVITHEGRAFSPDGAVNMTQAEAEAHNAALEVAELAAWKDRPERFIAYIARGAVVTTWRGVVLGHVIACNTWRNARAGHRMTYVRVRGNNGAVYAGTYGSDWSQAVCLRKLKHS